MLGTARIDAIRVRIIRVRVSVIDGWGLTIGVRDRLGLEYDLAAARSGAWGWREREGEDDSG